MAELVNIKTLNRLFNAETDISHMNFSGKCTSCGCDVKTTITITSGGYGFMGGVLYETEEGEFILKCSACFKDRKKLAFLHTNEAGTENPKRTQ